MSRLAAYPESVLQLVKLACTGTAAVCCVCECVVLVFPSLFFLYSDTTIVSVNGIAATRAMLQGLIAAVSELKTTANDQMTVW